MAIIENLIYVHKISESGAILTSTLTSGTPAVPFNMTGWTVTLNVRNGPTGAKIIDNAACSGSSLGVVTCTIEDDAFVEDIVLAEKDYKGEFKLVNGDVTLYWPKNRNNERTFFTFEVQKSLD